MTIVFVGWSLVSDEIWFYQTAVMITFNPFVIAALLNVQ